MTVTVLVVDDSGFFRRRLGEMINTSDKLKVVGTASNGEEAIAKALSLKPDVITMDYEMPVMDGITAVKQIMARCPTPILMFSSLTYEGARVTFDSLEAGAVDYLPKNFEEISKNAAELRKKLIERILTVATARSMASSSLATENKTSPTQEKRAVVGSSVRTSSEKLGSTSAEKLTADYKSTLQRARATELERRQSLGAARPRRSSASKAELVLIGTSTGGPVALQTVLTQLPADFSLPIVLIQHMPGSFTKAFAERLDNCCRIAVKEARDGDRLQAGVALLAPGGMQLMIQRGNKVKILPSDERLNYKPSVDVTFGSAANTHGEKTLGIVLTGMGNDGCEGARMLKQRGAEIWAQDEATSVIYGMPMAVANAQLADQVLPLTTVGERLCDLS